MRHLTMSPASLHPLPQTHHTLLIIPHPQSPTKGSSLGECDRDEHCDHGNCIPGRELYPPLIYLNYHLLPWDSTRLLTNLHSLQNLSQCLLLIAFSLTHQFPSTGYTVQMITIFRSLQTSPSR